MNAKAGAAANKPAIAALKTANFVELSALESISDLLLIWFRRSKASRLGSALSAVHAARLHSANRVFCIVSTAAGRPPVSSTYQHWQKVS
jgi:hypothetical protein